MLTKTEHKTKICRKSYKNIFKHFTTECHPVKAWLHVKHAAQKFTTCQFKLSLQNIMWIVFQLVLKNLFIKPLKIFTRPKLSLITHFYLPITHNWPHKAKIKPEKKTFYVFFKVHVDQIDQIIATHIYWPHGRKEKAKMFRQFLSAAGQ